MTLAQRRPLLAGLRDGGLSAAAFALAFPSASLWPLAFVALAPLLHLARHASDQPRRAALGALLAWIPAWSYLHQFAFIGTAAGAFPLVLYLTLYPAIFVWLLARAHRRWPSHATPITMLAGPTLWTALECLRGEVIWHGYPWFLLGQPTIEWTSFAALASITGVYSISFATALIAACVVVLVGLIRSPRPRTLRLGTVITALGALALGAFLGLRTAAPAIESRRIAVIQTDVAQSLRGRWSPSARLVMFDRWLSLTAEAAAADPPPDLIIWPETMFPGTGLNADAVTAERGSGLGFAEANIPLTYFHDTLMSVQSAIGTPLLIGAQATEGLRFIRDDEGIYAERDRSYNSVFLVDEGAVRPERYDKMHLTPFGEVMPYISAWPWLERQLLNLGARGMRFDLNAGTARTSFEIRSRPRPDSAPPFRLVAPICFEAALPGLNRRLVFEDGNGPRRANLIVNITNDGWFYGWQGGRIAHELFARWRCIEVRTPMVRAANTGISSIIATDGRFIARRTPPELAGEGILAGEVPLAHAGPTPFALGGWAFPWFTLAAGAILTIILYVPHGTNTGSPPPASPPQPKDCRA